MAESTEAGLGLKRPTIPLQNTMRPPRNANPKEVYMSDYNGVQAILTCLPCENMSYKRKDVEYNYEHVWTHEHLDNLNKK